MKNAFVKVANTRDIPVSQMKEFQVNGQNICLANIDGKYFAINNTCSHEGGPLADGKLEGYMVECPWHQSKFDVRTERLGLLQQLNHRQATRLRWKVTMCWLMLTRQQEKLKRELTRRNPQNIN